jgi:hypothetical protein
MPRHFPDDPVPHTEASPEFTRIFVIAVMTAVILGFLSGLFWVAWNLLLYVFR